MGDSERALLRVGACSGLYSESSVVLCDRLAVLHTLTVREILVSLPTGAGVVRLEDGSVLVAIDVTKADGFAVRDGDRFHPVEVISADEQVCVIGGLLPAGAVSAEVVDSRGVRVRALVARGAYVAQLEQPNAGSEPIVCCRDADGRPVRRPRAAGSPGVRVSDADEPCPACGASDFEEYRPSEAWPSGEVSDHGTVVSNLMVGCRVCGHEEPQAIVMRPPARRETSDRPLRLTELEAQAKRMRREFMWSAVAPGIQMQGFPVYAVAGWRAEISECGSEDDGRLTYVTVSHHATERSDSGMIAWPHLTVTTKRDDPQDLGALGEARHALQRWARPEHAAPDRPGTSNAARALRHIARSRRNRAAALSAAQSTHLMTIDGQATTALMLTASAGSWAAAAVRGKLTIIVAGHDLEPDAIEVAALADPAADFGPGPPGA